MKHYLAPIFATCAMTLSSCGTGEPAWQSSFNDADVRSAVFETTRDGQNCEPDQWGAELTREVEAQCVADTAVAREGFEFELVNCSSDVPQFSGLSGSDLESAEACLVKYKHISYPRHVRQAKLLGNEPPERLESRYSWIIYRRDGVPIAHKRL